MCYLFFLHNVCKQLIWKTRLPIAINWKQRNKCLHVRTASASQSHCFPIQCISSWWSPLTWYAFLLEFHFHGHMQWPTRSFSRFPIRHIGCWQSNSILMYPAPPCYHYCRASFVSSDLQSSFTASGCLLSLSLAHLCLTDTVWLVALYRALLSYAYQS